MSKLAISHFILLFILFYSIFFFYHFLGDGSNPIVYLPIESACTLESPLKVGSFLKMFCTIRNFGAVPRHNSFLYQLCYIRTDTHFWTSKNRRNESMLTLFYIISHTLQNFTFFLFFKKRGTPQIFCFFLKKGEQIKKLFK